MALKKKRDLNRAAFAASGGISLPYTKDLFISLLTVVHQLGVDPFVIKEPGNLTFGCVN